MVVARQLPTARRSALGISAPLLAPVATAGERRSNSGRVLPRPQPHRRESQNPAGTPVSVLVGRYSWRTNTHPRRSTRHQRHPPATVDRTRLAAMPMNSTLKHASDRESKAAAIRLERSTRPHRPTQPSRWLCAGACFPRAGGRGRVGCVMHAAKWKRGCAHSARWSRRGLIAGRFRAETRGHMVWISRRGIRRVALGGGQTPWRHHRDR